MKRYRTRPSASNEGPLARDRRPRHVPAQPLQLRPITRGQAHIGRRLGEWPKPVDIVLLRSWGGDESRSWGFAPDLRADEVDALGYAIMRDQLAFFRDLLRLGVFALVATDLSAREFDAMLRATTRLSRELGGRAKSGTATPDDEMDRWILEHLSLWATRPYDEFVLQGLPELFALVDRHRGRLAGGHHAA